MFMSSSLPYCDGGDARSDDTTWRAPSRAVPPPQQATDNGRNVERVAREHGDHLRRLARKLCRAPLDPDDLVQDVLEKLLRSPIPAGANERAWLARVTFNLFIDQVRRRRTRREELTAAPEPQIEPTDRAWWDHLGETDIRARIAGLPQEQRATFELFAFDGESYETIATRLGIAKATVGTRILRARQKLRVMFAEARGE